MSIRSGYPAGWLIGTKDLSKRTVVIHNANTAKSGGGGPTPPPPPTVCLYPLNQYTGFSQMVVNDACAHHLTAIADGTTVFGAFSSDTYPDSGTYNAFELDLDFNPGASGVLTLLISFDGTSTQSNAFAVILSPATGASPAVVYLDASGVPTLVGYSSHPGFSYDPAAGTWTVYAGADTATLTSSNPPTFIVPDQIPSISSSNTGMLDIQFYEKGGDLIGFYPSGTLGLDGQPTKHIPTPSEVSAYAANIPDVDDGSLVLVSRNLGGKLIVFYDFLTGIPQSIQWGTLANGVQYTHTLTSSDNLLLIDITDQDPNGLFWVKYTGRTPGMGILRAQATKYLIGDNRDYGTLEVVRWGTSDLSELQLAAVNCVKVPATAPSWTNWKFLFKDFQNFNGSEVSGWDTSAVTNMMSMFQNAYLFNQSLNSWDVSHVQVFESMFNTARAYNQPMDQWDTSGVVYTGSYNSDMRYMFFDAESFYQDISSWCVENIPSLPSMFDTGSDFEGMVAMQPQWGQSCGGTPPAPSCLINPATQGNTIGDPIVYTVNDYSENGGTYGVAKYQPLVFQTTAGIFIAAHNASTSDKHILEFTPT